MIYDIDFRGSIKKVEASEVLDVNGEDYTCMLVMPRNNFVTVVLGGYSDDIFYPNTGCPVLVFEKTRYDSRRIVDRLSQGSTASLGYLHRLPLDAIYDRRWQD